MKQTFMPMNLSICVCICSHLWHNWTLWPLTQWFFFHYQMIGSPSPATSLMWTASLLKEVLLLVEERRFWLVRSWWWWGGGRPQLCALHVDNWEEGGGAGGGTGGGGGEEMDEDGGVQMGGGDTDELFTPERQRDDIMGDITDDTVAQVHGGRWDQIASDITFLFFESRDRLRREELADVIGGGAAHQRVITDVTILWPIWERGQSLIYRERI